jgi:hypothetical protein
VTGVFLLRVWIDLPLIVGATALAVLALASRADHSFRPAERAEKARSRC